MDIILPAKVVKIYINNHKKIQLCHSQVISDLH